MFNIDKKYYLAGVVNIVFSAILYYLSYVGIVKTAIDNDAYYIIPTITLVSLLGLITTIVSYKDVNGWCLNATVNLGFMGTLVGVWTAFSSLETTNVGDISSLVNLVGSLISGIGVAIWTTLVGLFFYLWLGINIEVLDHRLDEE